jgi:AraC-like DNA-binding protein
VNTPHLTPSSHDTLPPPSQTRLSPPRPSRVEAPSLGAELRHEAATADWSCAAVDRSQLLAVTAGRAHLRGPHGDEHLVAAGTVILLPPGHGLVLLRAEGLKLTRLCFDIEGLLPTHGGFEPLGTLDAALLDPEAAAMVMVGVRPRHAGAVTEALGRIEAELREPRLGHELLLRAQLLELLVVLARAEHTADGDPGRHRPRLEPTLSMIHERYADPLTLASLAKHAGMSISRFSCVFREAFGTSPLEYVTDQRMREARRLLREPGRCVSEVAYAVGFQDSNYFSRAFKQHHGMSPREFRDMARIAG